MLTGAAAATAVAEEEEATPVASPRFFSLIASMIPAPLADDRVTDGFFF